MFKFQPKASQEKVLASENTQPSPTPTMVVENETQININSVKKANTPTPKPTNTVTPTQTQQNNFSGNLSNFQYPNASVASSSSNSLTLQSQDVADTISNWYEKQISNHGFSNIKVNIKNNVNTGNGSGEVYDAQISASNASETVNIEVSKPSGTSTVTISVTIG